MGVEGPAMRDERRDGMAGEANILCRGGGADCAGEKHRMVDEQQGNGWAED